MTKAITTVAALPPPFSGGLQRTLFHTRGVDPAAAYRGEVSSRRPSFYQIPGNRSYLRVAVTWMRGNCRHYWNFYQAVISLYRNFGDQLNRPCRSVMNWCGASARSSTLVDRLLPAGLPAPSGRRRQSVVYVNHRINNAVPLLILALLPLPASFLRGDSHQHGSFSARHRPGSEDVGFCR